MQRLLGGHFRHLTHRSQQFPALTAEVFQYFINLLLALADKVKQSKLRILNFIEPVHGLNDPMSGNYRLSL